MKKCKQNRQDVNFSFANKPSPGLPVVAKFAFALAGLVFCTTTIADVLLTGEVFDHSNEKVGFSLSGENLEDVVGGEIKLGDARFEITHVSVHSLVGAVGQGNPRKFAVFSSSYTEQTATGQPWIASDSYLYCDQQYNSFLAIYSVNDDQAEELPEPPFANLTDSTDHSESSVVYCFISNPAAK